MQLITFLLLFINSIHIVKADSICNNPDFLKVMYFFLIIVDIVKIVVPIGLIVMGLMDFSKSVTASDEKVQKKSVTIFVKRVMAAILVFLVPWIVEVLMVTLGNLLGEDDEVNFTDCIENANAEKISELENKQEELNRERCWQCNDNPSLYYWGSTYSSSSGCHAGWHELNLTKSQCYLANKDSSEPGTDNNNGYDYIIYVGDSRTVGMCSANNLSSNEDCSIAKVGVGYNFLNSDEVNKNLKSILNSHPNSYIVINLGTNSGLSASEAEKFAKKYNDMAGNYPNAKVVAVSVTQVDFEKAKKAGMYASVNGDASLVSSFNKNLKNSLSSNVMYCDVYSKMENYNYVATDGVHYNKETYKFIYNEIQKCLK